MKMARSFGGGSFGASPFPISATSLKHPRKSLPLWQKHHDVHLSYAPTFVDSIKSCQTKQQKKQNLDKWVLAIQWFFVKLWIWGTHGFGDTNQGLQGCHPLNLHPYSSPMLDGQFRGFIHPLLAKFLQLPGWNDVRNDREGHEISGNNEPKRTFHCIR